jgi:hypothetical protein
VGAALALAAVGWFAPAPLLSAAEDAAALVGKWTAKSDAATVTLTLGGDGGYEIEVRQGDQASKAGGRFKVADGKLTLEPAGDTAVVFAMALREGSLVLTGGDLPAGQSLTFARQKGLFAPLFPGGGPVKPPETTPETPKREPPVPAAPAPDWKPVGPVVLSDPANPDVLAADVALTPDNALHAVYSERNQATGAFLLYHRVSRDGGANWSDRTDLSGFDRETGAGYHRLLVDGAGRLYVVWKRLRGIDRLNGDAKGTLTYRVLEGGAGAWSKPVTVGGADHAFGWFATVDPAGRAHLVWIEDVMTASDYWPGAAAAMLFLRSELSGATASPPAKVWNDRPAVANGMIAVDCYRAPRGYVDAGGGVRLVAEKVPCKDYNNPLVVLIDGRSERPLFKASRFGPGNSSSTHFGDGPVELFRDAAGREHAVVLDLKSPRPALVDLVVGSDEEPTVIRGVAEPRGEVRGFNLVQGRDGRVALLMRMRDRDADVVTDLWLTRHDGKGWSAPENLTRNDPKTGRGFGRGAEISIPVWADGTFDGAGRLNLAVVLGAYRSVGYRDRPTAFFLRP